MATGLRVWRRDSHQPEDREKGRRQLTREAGKKGKRWDRVAWASPYARVPILLFFLVNLTPNKYFLRFFLLCILLLS